MPNPWPNSPRLPGFARAVLAALDLRDPRRDALSRLSEGEWRAALDYCDRSRLTLALRHAARDAMPPWVRERTDQNAAANLLRLAALEAKYREVAGWLQAAGVEFVALKGITHGALFGVGREIRMQYDIDLFCPRESVRGANAALLERGYRPMEGMESVPTDHLPALVPKNAWAWRGDFFDRDIPTPVEIHFRFWNEDLERLPAPGTEEFWGRRTTRPAAAIELPVLSPADALAFAALHLLKHVLRRSAHPFHVYELACLLESRAADAAFWGEWRTLHAPGLRRLEAVSFQLATAWFSCGLAPIAREEIEALPAATGAWFAEFAASPAGQLFHSSKDELWLHLSLLDSRRDRWRVAQRRLLPASLPPSMAGYTPAGDTAYRRHARYLAHVAQRLRHHALALPLTALSGARWWWRVNSLGRQFWIFLAAAIPFNFALFPFALLYNLFLMDLGFHEDSLGMVNGAVRAGSVVGTLPAAWLAHRLGLRNMFLATIAGTAIDMALRTLAGTMVPLTALAFAGGVIFSMWAVIMAPLIAGAVEERRRPAAFSIFFAAMFATGIAGNWIGGRLPLWLHGKQGALLLSAALAASAFLPALRLRPALPAPAGTRIYPRSRFLWRFLAPFAVWHLATGSFNPFNNVYFSRLRFPVERIGSLFSATQVTQVVTVLLAPAIFRRAGMVAGIGAMMAATALSLGGLAAQPTANAAALAYIAYMSFQWMSEPGLNALLMNHVEERERSGASALTYLVAFAAQALAAVGAGALLARLGYGVVLAGAAALAGLAAALFQVLVPAKKTA